MGTGTEEEVCVPPGHYHFYYNADNFLNEMSYQIEDLTTEQALILDEGSDPQSGQEDNSVNVRFTIGESTSGFETTLENSLFSGTFMDNVNGNTPYIHQVCCSTLITITPKTSDSVCVALLLNMASETDTFRGTTTSSGASSGGQHCIQNDTVSGYWVFPPSPSPNTGIDEVVTGNALQLTLALTSLQGEGGDEIVVQTWVLSIARVHYSFSQTLDMPAGWSIISTYIEEQDADGNTAMVVDEIFSEINDEVIILKDYLGAAWLKEWNFNGVGAMGFGKGYQIKLNHPLQCFPRPSSFS